MRRRAVSFAVLLVSVLAAACANSGEAQYTSRGRRSRYDVHDVEERTSPARQELLDPPRRPANFDEDVQVESSSTADLYALRSERLATKPKLEPSLEHPNGAMSRSKFNANSRSLEAERALNRRKRLRSNLEPGIDSVVEPRDGASVEADPWESEEPVTAPARRTRPRARRDSPREEDIPSTLREPETREEVESPGNPEMPLSSQLRRSQRTADYTEPSVRDAVSSSGYSRHRSTGQESNAAAPARATSAARSQLALDGEELNREPEDLLSTEDPREFPDHRTAPHESPSAREAQVQSANAREQNLELSSEPSKFEKSSPSIALREAIQEAAEQLQQELQSLSTSKHEEAVRLSMEELSTMQELVAEMKSTNDFIAEALDKLQLSLGSALRRVNSLRSLKVTLT